MSAAKKKAAEAVVNFKEATPFPMPSSAHHIQERKIMIDIRYGSRYWYTSPRNGVAVLTSFVSPYREIRAESRKEIDNFVEAYAKCSLDACIQRDVKGMYQKAIEGKIKEFTGISDPYEEPLNPEILVETDRETLEESTQKVLKRLEELGYL